MIWIVVLLLALAAGGYLLYREFGGKTPTVADITRPLHDIVEKLEGHAADQHVAADQHTAAATASTAAASHARASRDHARHVARKVKDLVNPEPTGTAVKA